MRVFTTAVPISRPLAKASVPNALLSASAAPCVSVAETPPTVSRRCFFATVTWDRSSARIASRACQRR